MTPQEIFDYVKNHFEKQQTASMDGGACRYRTKDGKSCAVGCLIPVSQYKDAFETGISDAIFIDLEEYSLDDYPYNNQK